MFLWRLVYRIDISLYIVYNINTNQYLLCRVQHQSEGIAVICFTHAHHIWHEIVFLTLYVCLCIQENVSKRKLEKLKFQ